MVHDERFPYSSNPPKGNVTVMLCCGGGSQGITVAPCAGGRGLAHGVTFQTSGSRQSAERDSDTVRLAIVLLLLFSGLNTVKMIQITAFWISVGLKQTSEKCRAKLRDYSSLRDVEGKI